MVVLINYQLFSVWVLQLPWLRERENVAVVSLSMFLFFIYANNAWLTSHNMLAKAGAFGLSGTGSSYGTRCSGCRYGCTSWNLIGVYLWICI